MTPFLGGAELHLKILHFKKYIFITKFAKESFEIHPKNRQKLRSS